VYGLTPWQTEAIVANDWRGEALISLCGLSHMQGRGGGKHSGQRRGERGNSSSAALENKGRRQAAQRRGRCSVEESQKLSKKSYEEAISEMKKANRSEESYDYEEATYVSEEMKSAYSVHESSFRSIISNLRLQS